LECDNAVAESFFSLLKKDRVKRKIYKTRDNARSEIFDYIEGFYNPRRNHGTNNRLSPEEMEMQYFRKLGALRISSKGKPLSLRIRIKPFCTGIATYN
jgi:transposase InsO family protein